MTRGSRSRARPDHYSRRARQQSYPARSIFKLEEIDRKHRVFRPGQAVLDLGAAPGSWLLYAASRVGDSGLVVGVDRHSLTVPVPRNARYVKADALQIGAGDLVEVCPRPFDVVLSDMAPHTSGNRFVDQQRSLRLFLRALEIAGELGRARGSFLGKIFNGEDVDQALDRAGALYESVRVVKPKAVRKGSYEIYVLGLGRRPGPEGPPNPDAEGAADRQTDDLPAGQAPPLSMPEGGGDSGSDVK